MTDELWYPISQVAEIFKQSYAYTASMLEPTGIVRVDRLTQLPCVPESYLRRFPEFDFWQRQANGLKPLQLANREIPVLKQAADMFTLRQIRKHSASLFDGELTGPEQLDTLLMYGRWRYRKAGPSYYYRLSDFIKPDGWASPAEVSWRTGLAVIREAIAEKKKRLGPPDPPPPAPTEASPEEEGPEPIITSGPDAFPWALSSVDLKLAPKLEDANAFVPGEEGYTRFKFHQRIRQPRAEDLADYVGFLPMAFLEGAEERVLAWKDCLEEERLGVRRATGSIADTVFREQFAATERSIYRERKAWTQGFLVPLMPPGFAFLF